MLIHREKEFDTNVPNPGHVQSFAIGCEQDFPSFIWNIYHWPKLNVHCGATCAKCCFQRTSGSSGSGQTVSLCVAVLLWWCTRQPGDWSVSQWWRNAEVLKWMFGRAAPSENFTRYWHLEVSNPPVKQEQNKAKSKASHLAWREAFKAEIKVTTRQRIANIQKRKGRGKLDTALAKESVQMLYRRAIITFQFSFSE